MVQRKQIQAYWQSTVDALQLLNGPWVGLSLRDFEAVRPEFFINLAEFTENGGFLNRWFLLLRGKNKDAWRAVW